MSKGLSFFKVDDHPPLNNADALYTPVPWKYQMIDGVVYAPRDILNGDTGLRYESTQ